MAELGQSHEPQAFLHPFKHQGPGNAKRFQCECHLRVTTGREYLLIGILRNKTDLLQEVVGRALTGVDSVQRDPTLQGPPGEPGHKPRHDPRQGCLSGIGSAEKDGHAAPGDDEGQPVVDARRERSRNAGVAELHILHDEQ